ncbi:MAG: peptide ABC transporter substrate-binding protein, partial [Burkholderiales bacterium PBB5]
REKGGRKLRFLFQTSANGVRQKTQVILKQACQKAGIELELKAITPAVYFSGDAGNPDTNAKFNADMQMYAVVGGVDPERGMDAYVSWELATKANKWQGRNISRWRNDEFDKLFRAAEVELDGAKRAAMFIRMNDLVVADHHILPIVHRPSLDGVGTKIAAHIGWTGVVGSIHHWFREA